MTSENITLRTSHAFDSIGLSSALSEVSVLKEFKTSIWIAVSNIFTLRRFAINDFTYILLVTATLEMIAYQVLLQHIFYREKKYLRKLW